MNAAPFSHHRRAASSLLLVLWALLLLSAAVFAFAKWMQQDMQLHAEANRDQEARAMAHSGMAFALIPQVTKLTPGLEEEFQGELGYRVRIVSEAGRLNIKWLLEGETPVKLDILNKWLERRGLGFNERQIFIDCLLDWVDGDNAHRLNGVEDDGDYHPPNRMLQSVEEIAQVHGAEPLTATEGWQESLTIYGTNGRINPLAADLETLRLLPGNLADPRLQAFVTYRRGRDGLDGTKDDPKFKSIEEVLTQLGSAGAGRQLLVDLVTIDDQIMRVTSEGRSADAYRQVEAVVLKGGGKPTIYSWKE